MVLLLYMQCDQAEVQGLPCCTSSRVGDLPVEEIDAVMSASAAAVVEMAMLGPQLAAALLEYGLSVYHLHSQKLAELRPDVIITTLQTSHGAVLQQDLMHAALATVLSDNVPTVVHLSACDLDGVWDDMRKVAKAVDAAEAGEELIARLQRQMSGAAASGRGRERSRVVCIQWPHPLMAASTWVPAIVQMAGGTDACGKADVAALISPQELFEAKPDVLIFALCGIRLAPSVNAATAAIRRIESTIWSQLPAVKVGRVAVVDGEHVLSRPGPLLVQSLECLIEILHPEAQPFGHEGTLWQWLPSCT